jgi:hypothetical protein
MAGNSKTIEYVGRIRTLIADALKVDDNSVSLGARVKRPESLSTVIIGSRLHSRVLLRLNQISRQNPEESVVGAMEFDFPISGPNDRFVGNCTRVAAVRALLPAHRTGLVSASANVHHVGH